MPRDSGAILLIDPNPDARALHADALRRDGFSVVAVTDCEAAHVALATLAPQLIIASFDGQTRDERFAFCERLKVEARTRAVPILLTSDAIDRDDLQRATKTKALVLSLCSPLDDTKLISAVRGVLAVRERSRPSEDPRITRTA